jgi:outer membrane lipoprotein-sorting protein
MSCGLRHPILLICLLAGLAGCSREPFPRAPLEPVTRFSLGSAKFTPFRSRPTGKELYDAAIKLYASFGSVAATAEVPGRPGSRSDLRFDSGGRRTLVSNWLGGSVLVCDGNRGLVYVPKSNSFFRRRPAWGAQRPDVAALWAGLMPSPGRPFDSYRLLSDTVTNGTPVYVLELHEPARGKYPAQITRAYLGKVDLLPRRLEYQDIETSKGRGRTGRPSQVATQVFTGFEVNITLPDALFSTTPPKGARPAKRGPRGEVILDS